MASRYKVNKAIGKCVDCGKPPMSKRPYCGPCLERRRVWESRDRASRKAREAAELRKLQSIFR